MQVDLRWKRVSYHRRLGGDVLTFGLMPVDSDVGFMKWKIGLQGGLIRLHVQAPCIIVACACRLGQWAGQSYHAGLAGCWGRSFFY